MLKEFQLKVTDYHVRKSLPEDWLTLREVTGSFEPKRTRNGNNNVIMNEAHWNYLAHYLDNIDCQLYHAEMSELLDRTFNVKYTEDQIKAALKRHDYTQKVVERIPLEQDSDERSAFREMLRDIEFGGVFSAEMFVFADETHCNVDQARRKYGYARKGQPAFRPAWRTHGHGESFSAICTMGIKGIRTVTSHEGGVNADVFMDTLKNVILPTMGKVGEPFSVLVLDNASVHDKLAVITAVQEHGSLVIFLPPYSFDYNPIEYCFHVAKSYLRDMYHIHDLRQSLIPQFEEALYNCCSPEMAINLFTHCQLHVSELVRAWALE